MDTISTNSTNSSDFEYRIAKLPLQPGDTLVLEVTSPDALSPTVKDRTNALEMILVSPDKSPRVSCVSSKVRVPKYVATKCFQIANLASPWFAASAVLMFLNRGAALGCALIALAICCIAVWFAYVERQEPQIIQESGQ